MAKVRHLSRNVHGIVLLDKPAGITSNKALQVVKHLFHAKKAGHTGSLDPLATGLLPLCLGEATKVSNFLLNANKTYIATCQLGVRTDSADANGKVIETHQVGKLSQAQLNAILRQFTGTIKQVPPMHSAIKQNGTPLYKLAHQGIEVHREAREVTIYSLKLISLRDDAFDIEVVCSKGTYIRTLADDIGKTLGCGAHISGLRRTHLGPFEIVKAVTQEKLQALAQRGFEALDEILVPIEDALQDWPDVCLSSDASFYIQQGQPVFIPKLPTHGWVRLFSPDEHFLGVGMVLDDGRVAPKRLMNISKIG